MFDHLSPPVPSPILRIELDVHICADSMFIPAVYNTFKRALLTLWVTKQLVSMKNTEGVILLCICLKGLTILKYQKEKLIYEHHKQSLQNHCSLDSWSL